MAAEAQERRFYDAYRRAFVAERPRIEARWTTTRVSVQA
jgi:hypothetical protein